MEEERTEGKKKSMKRNSIKQKDSGGRERKVERENKTRQIANCKHKECKTIRKDEREKSLMYIKQIQVVERSKTRRKTYRKEANGIVNENTLTRKKSARGRRENRFH